MDSVSSTTNVFFNEELTDAESIAETTSIESTSGVNGVTGSETDYGDDTETVKEQEDDILNQLLDSQFPSSPKASQDSSQKKDVQGWINESPMLHSESDGNNLLPPEDIQKMAAAVAHAVATEPFPFEANAWNDEDDQEVPVGNFKIDFMRDCARRLPLHLMNTIKVLCSPSGTLKGYRPVYESVLIHAVLINAELKDPGERLPNLSAETIKKQIKEGHINKLLEYRNCEYFSDLRLHFNPRTVSQKQRLIICAVEEAVNTFISRAHCNKNAEIFSAFGNIVKIVEECNERKSLGYTPDKVAKYALRLQTAVSSELILRCLNFLAFLGYPLRPDLWGSTTEALLNESIITLSSQGSYISEGGSQDLPSSQGSFLSASEDELASLRSESESDQDDLIPIARNRPRLQEYLRVPSQDSPARSWTRLSPSLSSPLSSIPERERSPIVLNEDSNSLEERQNMFEWGDQGNYSFASQGSRSNNNDSDEEGQPSRRRMRLELEQ